jgi:hypothetical protein
VIQRAIRGLLVLLLLALPGCDNYNLSFKEFFSGGDVERGDTDEGGAVDTVPDDGDAADTAPDNGGGPDTPVPPMGSDTAKAITGFTITSPVPAVGTIKEAAKTITVKVPYGTVVTNMVPDITYIGASISPASGEELDFTVPVLYTVTAGSSTVSYTVTVIFVVPLANISAYLSGYPGADPVPLAVDITLDAAGWPGLLTAINAASRDVALDLSAAGAGTHSTGGGLYIDGTFDPVSSISTGKDRIVSLVLPDTAAVVKAGADLWNPTFQNFSSLESVEGMGITDISDFAFRNLSTLTRVDFPAVQIIGERAFNFCTGLTELSFPAVTDIGYRAFDACEGLTELSFPAAVTIGEWVFSNCLNLIRADLPELTNINHYTFNFCRALTTVTLPEAVTVGVNAFSYCDALTTLNLPRVTNIDNFAFYYCDVLTTLRLPLVTELGNNAFQFCTALADLYFPAAPPALGTDVFKDTEDTIAPTTLNIHVPSGAASAYTSSALPGWDVGAVTAAGMNTGKYGDDHKAISITEAP